MQSTNSVLFVILPLLLSFFSCLFDVAEDHVCPLTSQNTGEVMVEIPESPVHTYTQGYVVTGHMLSLICAAALQSTTAWYM